MPVDSKLLIRRQEALVMLIHTEDSVHGKALDRVSQGLKLYQVNLFETAAKELKHKYPVLAGIIGSKQLEKMAIALLKLEQLTSGGWINWGKDLEEAIQKSKLLQSFPYIADLAKFEWLVHLAKKGSDSVDQLASLNQVLSRDTDSIEIEFIQSLSFMKSDFPIFEIWDLFQSKLDSEVQQESIKELISTQIGPFCYALNQQGLRVDVNALSVDEYKWLVALQSRNNIGQVTERYPDIDS